MRYIKMKNNYRVIRFDNSNTIRYFETRLEAIMHTIANGGRVQRQMVAGFWMDIEA